MKVLLSSFLLFFVAGIAKATAGPVLKQKDPEVQREMEKIYQAITFPDITNGTAQIFTISSGTIQSFMVVGTSGANDAPSGRVGEDLSSSVSLQDAGTSGQFYDVTSLSITPGKWLIIGEIVWTRNGATLTNPDFEAGISVTSGNSSLGLTEGINLNYFDPVGVSTVNNVTLHVIYTTKLSTTTTHYLKAVLAGYSAAVPKNSGTLRAIRIF